jgi:hypothetical protein
MLLLLLGGCASSTYTWRKADATAETTARDNAGCRAEAGGQTFEQTYPSTATPWNWSPWRRPYTGPYPDASEKAAAEQRAYEHCMRGRGYDFVRSK